MSPGRIAWTALSVLLAARLLPGAEARLVLPAAASIHGANRTFFHTDLRVLNLSYVTAADVQAVYHCLGGGACASLARCFTVGPRQNLALDEVVASLFEAPETAGAIEFLYDDSAGPLVVNARIYTPQTPLPSHGGWIAARRVEQASVRCVFGQVALSADWTSGFRTNAGGFNPGPATVTAVYTLRRGDGIALGSASRRIAPGEFFQFDGTIGDAAGVLGVTDTNLYLSLAADGLFFPYAVVIDNQSGDLFFVDPADDSVPSHAISLLVTLSRYQFSPGGPDGPPIRLQASVTYRITFRSNDVEHGISAIPLLGIASAAIVPGADYVITVTPSLAQRGRYTFACTRVCGASHGGMFGAIEVE